MAQTLANSLEPGMSPEFALPRPPTLQLLRPLKPTRGRVLQCQRRLMKSSESWLNPFKHLRAHSVRIRTRLHTSCEDPAQTKRTREAKDQEERHAAPGRDPWASIGGFTTTEFPAARATEIFLAAMSIGWFLALQRPGRPQKELKQPECAHYSHHTP